MNEEQARIRGYLVAQGTKLAPAAIVEKVQQAMADLKTAATAVPAARFGERPAPEEWSGNEVMAHVLAADGYFAGSILSVLEGGPPLAAIGRPRHRGRARALGRGLVPPPRASSAAPSSRRCSPPIRPPAPTCASSTRCSARSPGGRRCSSPGCTISITPASSRRSRRPSRRRALPDARLDLAAPGPDRLGGGERLRDRGRAPGRGRRLVRGGLGPRRRHPARVHGRAYLAHPPRHRNLAGRYPHARAPGHDRDEHAGHVQRPLPAGPGRERAPGDRGLARHPLRPPGPAHAGDGGDRPPRDPGRAPRVQGEGLRAAAPGRRGQGPPLRRPAPAERCRSTWPRSRRRASR